MVIKTPFLIIVAALYSANLLLGQNYISAQNKDTLFLKKVDSSLLSFPKNIQSIKMKLPFSYHYNFTNHKLTLSLFDTISGELLNTHTEQKTWWEDTTDYYYIQDSGFRIMNNKTYLYVGLVTNHIFDINSGESHMYPSFFCFCVDSNYSISLFAYYPERFNQLISDYYAFGYTYYYSGGGYTQDCDHYYTYIFNEDSIILNNSFTNCFGYQIAFIDNTYNRYCNVFLSRHPDVGICTIKGVSKDLDLLWTINESPSIYSFSSHSVSVNGRNNYLISIGQLFDFKRKKENYIEDYLFIIDLMEGKIKDTLLFNYENGPINGGGLSINQDTNNILYFTDNLLYNKGYYIIDHFRELKTGFQLPPNTQKNDTIGQIVNSPVYGGQVRFKSSTNNNYSIDSLTGIVTALKDYSEISDEITTLPCMLTDGIDTLLKEISIEKIVDIPQHYSENVPNITICNNKLQIEGIENFRNPSIEIFDISGKCLISQPVVPKNTVYLKQLPVGIYLVRVITESNTSTMKIIRN